MVLGTIMKKNSCYRLIDKEFLAFNLKIIVKSAVTAIFYALATHRYSCE